MKFAKFFSILVFASMALYGAIGFYFLPFATFQGELTRMGLLPEYLFGWTKPQPAIDAKWMQQASMKDADVLVIGDSFSDGRVWQTVLTQKGLKVRTESWDSLRGICEDFVPWLRAQGFSGKQVVFESVERNLENDLHHSLACQQMQYHSSSKTDTPRYPPATSMDLNFKDYSGKLSTGIRTRLNVLEYERKSGSADFKSWLLPNEIRLARVAQGCKLFSHAACHDALFLGYDQAGEINANALDNIEQLNARLKGLTPVWVFVPNKSTVYLYPKKQFWNEAERRFKSPNLLKAFNQAIAANTVDLYPANNTHVSTTGYLLMGEQIWNSLSADSVTR